MQPQRVKYQYIDFILFLGFNYYLVYIWFKKTLEHSNISTNQIFDINHKLLSLLIESKVY